MGTSTIDCYICFVGIIIIWAFIEKIWLILLEIIHLILQADYIAVYIFQFIHVQQSLYCLRIPCTGFRQFSLQTMVKLHLWYLLLCISFSLFSLHFPVISCLLDAIDIHYLKVWNLLIGICQLHLHTVKFCFLSIKLTFAYILTTCKVAQLDILLVL